MQATGGGAAPISFKAVMLNLKRQQDERKGAKEEPETEKVELKEIPAEEKKTDEKSSWGRSVMNILSPPTHPHAPRSPRSSSPPVIVSANSALNDYSTVSLMQMHMWETTRNKEIESQMAKEKDHTPQCNVRQLYLSPPWRQRDSLKVLNRLAIHTGIAKDIIRANCILYANIGIDGLQQQGKIPSKLTASVELVHKAGHGRLSRTSQVATAISQLWQHKDFQEAFSHPSLAKIEAAAKHYLPKVAKYVEDFEITSRDEEFITTKPGPVTDLKVSALSPSPSPSSATETTTTTTTASTGDQEVLETRNFSVTAYLGTDYYGKRSRFRWSQTFIPEQNSGLLLVYLVEACSVFRKEEVSKDGDEDEGATSEKFEDQITVFGQIVKAFDSPNIRFLTLIWDFDEFEKEFNLKKFSRKFKDFREKNSFSDKPEAQVACELLGEKFGAEVSDPDLFSHLTGSLSDPTLFSKILAVVHQMETAKP